MCAGCGSNAQAAGSVQHFGGTSSMGDDGIAMKNAPEFDGDSGQSGKFEGLAPSKATSGKQAELSGRQ